MAKTHLVCKISYLTYIFLIKHNNNNIFLLKHILYHILLFNNCKKVVSHKSNSYISNNIKNLNSNMFNSKNSKLNTTWSPTKCKIIQWNKSKLVIIFMSWNLTKSKIFLNKHIFNIETTNKSNFKGNSNFNNKYMKKELEVHNNYMKKEWEMNYKREKCSKN